MARLFVKLLTDGKVVKSMPANNSVSAEVLYGNQTVHKKIDVSIAFKDYGGAGKKVELSIDGKKYRAYDFKE